MKKRVTRSQKKAQDEVKEVSNSQIDQEEEDEKNEDDEEKMMKEATKSRKRSIRRS